MASWRYYACGYKESKPGDIVHREYIQHWDKLIGNCSYIVKPYTDFTKEWYNYLINPSHTTIGIMELFLPSLLVFLVAIIIIAFLLPRMSPLIIVLMSAGLLGFGIYHHFNLFWDEYRQSTWQDQMKLFAPGIMLVIIVLYVLFALLTVFTSGQVPVPTLPNVELPSAESATNAVTETINNALQAIMPNNTVKNNANRGNNQGNSQGNQGNQNRVNNQGNQANQGNENKRNKQENNITRSFLATI